MSTYNCIFTDSDNKDFQKLNHLIDQYHASLDGDKTSFYNQFNKIDHLRQVILIYVDDLAIACGAIKQYDEITMELKRMFVLESYRGKGFAGIVLLELEKWAKQLNAQKLILETGVKHNEAIQFYNKKGFYVIPNYDQYEGVDTSICFAKNL